MCIDKNKLTLKCIKLKWAHWGEIFIVDNKYTGKVIYKPTKIIISNLYTKKLDLPFFQTKGEDNNIYLFCLLTIKEVENLCNSNKISFSYTTHLIDTFFDYKPIRRENKINYLLKNE